jgi:tellurite resistance protein TerC
MLGVAIGILTMRFAAGIFSYAVEREPILQQAAYILVFNIGIELILDQVWHIETPDLVRFGISITTILLALVWLAQGIGIINEFVDWLFIPFKSAFRLTVEAVKQIPAPRPS